MKKIRDILYLVIAIIFFWLYFPHLIIISFSKKKKELVFSDVDAMCDRISIHIQGYIGLLFFLHNNRYFRTLFYYRVGPIWAMLIKWYRPGDRYFVISKTLKLGKGCQLAHPFSTEINAVEIGDNFSCRHCTTLGAKPNGRPYIGNNVYLGASVTIIGNVHIGNNVIVGAGSVVVKDVSDNCVVAGNPAKVVKYLDGGIDFKELITNNK